MVGFQGELPMGQARYGIEMTMNIVCPDVFLHEHQKTAFATELLDLVRLMLLDEKYKFDDKLTDFRSFEVAVSIKTRKEVENEVADRIKELEANTWKPAADSIPLLPAASTESTPRLVPESDIDPKTDPFHIPGWDNNDRSEDPIPRDWITKVPGGTTELFRGTRRECEERALRSGGRVVAVYYPVVNPSAAATTPTDGGECLAKIKQTIANNSGSD